MTDEIVQYRQQHPEAEEYCLKSEHQAAALLTVIAATVKVQLRDIKIPRDAARARAIRNGMLSAVQQHRALDYIRDLEEPLWFVGLQINTPAPVEH